MWCAQVAYLQPSGSECGNGVGSGVAELQYPGAGQLTVRPTSVFLCTFLYEDTVPGTDQTRSEVSQFFDKHGYELFVRFNVEEEEEEEETHEYGLE